MFDISWGELILIGVVALIAIGPKELPAALRTLGQWTTKIRRMANDFQNQFNEAMREAEMADLKKQVDTLTSSYDPIETARREMESAMEDKPAASTATTAPEPTGYAEAPPVETTGAGPAVGTGEASTAPVAPVEPAAENAPDTGTSGSDAVPQPAGGRPA